MEFQLTTRASEVVAYPSDARDVVKGSEKAWAQQPQVSGGNQMQHSNKWMAVVMMFACLALSACTGKGETRTSKVEPAHVEEIEGKDVKLVILTERAMERTDVRTAPVRSVPGRGKVVPYSAVIYDPHGHTWVYTSPKPRHFVRESIAVDRIDGDLAFLSDGPAVGTKVITMGAAEVYGTEFEVGH